MAAITLEGERRDQTDAHRYLRIVDLRCAIQDQTLTVWAVVWNPSPEPAVLEPNDIQVLVGQFKDERGFPMAGRVWVYIMTWPELKDELQILEAGETLRLSGQSEPNKYIPSADDRCVLTSSNWARPIRSVSELIDHPGATPRPGIRRPPPPPPNISP